MSQRCSTEQGRLRLSGELTIKGSTLKGSIDLGKSTTMFTNIVVVQKDEYDSRWEAGTLYVLLEDVRYIDTLYAVYLNGMTIGTTEKELKALGILPMIIF